MALNHMECTDADAEEFLLLLLVLKSRCEGLSKFQISLNKKVADEAFFVLYDIMMSQSLLFPTFLKALKKLMTYVECTDEALYQRPVLPPTVKIEFEKPDAVGTSGMEDVGPQPPRGLGQNKPLEGVTPKTQYHRWLYTFDCLSAADRGPLTEKQYQLMLHDFTRIDRKGCGEVDTNDINMAGGTIGGRIMSQSLLQALDEDGSGKLSFYEMLMGFYQMVPRRFLQRRLQNEPLPDSPDTIVVGDNPMVSTESHIEYLNLRIAQYQRNREAGMVFSRQIVELISEWFDCVDADSSGEISMREIQLVDCKIGLWSLDSQVFKKIDKNGSRNIGLFELLREFLPDVPEEQMKRVVTEVGKERELAHVAAIERKEKSDEDWNNEQLRLLQQKMETCTDYIQLEKLHETERDLQETALIHRKIQKKLQRAREIAGQKRTAQAIQQHLLSEYMKEVPLVYGVESKPPECVVYGLRLTREAFLMDVFLSRDDTRDSAIRMLQRLDYSGVNTFWFRSKSHALHCIIPRPWCSRCKVYRDFVFCPPKPSMGRPWKSDHVLHMKTNIPRRSGVKYQLILEGYNWGVNCCVRTTVVGYTGVQWESLNTMEDFGWPEGWDTRTSQVQGLEAVTQYFSSDGYVSVKLTAKSFVHVGFGVTALLVTMDYGSGFPLTVTFSHQEDAL